MRNAAFGEVIAGDLASGVGLKRLLPALGDLLVEFAQLILNGPFLALARAGAAPPPLAAWRVVDDPHAPKGKVELTACGAAGWVPVRLLRRHRAAPNRAVERAHRGDLLAIDAAIVDGRIELGPDDTVAPIA